MEHFIETFVFPHVYLGVAVLMLLESACIPIPSEITMLVAGVAAKEHHANFWLAVAIGVAANVAGSLLAYGVGRAGGRPMVSRFGKYVFLREHDVDRAERWFDRYGEAAVFFSRLLPVVRTFISLPAGVARMKPGRFTLYTALGCLPWVAVLTWVGYLVGDNWKKIPRYFTIVSVVIGLLLIVWIVRAVLKRRREGASEPETGTPAPLP